jgi:hypothetical protein
VSVPADIAQAVTDLLNAGVVAGTFAPWNFTAIRTYSPPRDLETIQELIVLVMATAENATVAARGSDQLVVTVQVAVCKKIEVIELANNEIDELMSLVQSINDTCRARPLAMTPPAAWQARRRNPVYDAEALQTMGLFLSVTEHDYHCVRAVA